MQLKERPKECLEKGNVEEVTTQTIMLGDWVSKDDTFIVGRCINPLVVEQMRKVVIEKLHKLLHIEPRFWWALLREAQLNGPL